MTLYELIMGGVRKFSRLDWGRLGRGEVKDDDTIAKMLAEGYGAMADED